MKTIIGYWVKGCNVCLFCQTEQSTKQWVDYILRRGVMPEIEPIYE